MFNFPKKYKKKAQFLSDSFSDSLKYSETYITHMRDTTTKKRSIDAKIAAGLLKKWSMKVQQLRA